MEKLKSTNITKSSWMYLKAKSTNKETNIQLELDKLIKKDMKKGDNPE